MKGEKFVLTPEASRNEITPAEAIERIKGVIDPGYSHYDQLLMRMDKIVELGNGEFLSAIASNETVMENLKTNPLLLIHLGAYPIGVLQNKEALDNLIFNSGLKTEANRESAEAVKHRIETNPDKSPEEASAGIYWESLEPQVRDAIISLSRKGYQTFESGFKDRIKGSQYIGTWKSADGEPFQITGTLREQLKDKGVDIVVDSSLEDRDYLLLIPQNPRLDLKEWKQVWDLVADALPTRS